MSRDELDKASAWLRAKADQIERDEPYATTPILALRYAADEMDSAEEDDEI